MHSRWSTNTSSTRGRENYESTENKTAAAAANNAMQKHARSYLRWGGKALRISPFMRARILVVDVSSFSRKILRAILEDAGYDVFEVDNDYTALEQYPQVRPDIVMLDLVMAPID